MRRFSIKSVLWEAWHHGDKNWFPIRTVSSFPWFCKLGVRKIVWSKSGWTLLHFFTLRHFQKCGEILAKKKDWQTKRTLKQQLFNGCWVQHHFSHVIHEGHPTETIIFNSWMNFQRESDILRLQLPVWRRKAWPLNDDLLRIFLKAFCRRDFVQTKRDSNGFWKIIFHGLDALEWNNMKWSQT